MSSSSKKRKGNFVQQQLTSLGYFLSGSIFFKTFIRQHWRLIILFVVLVMFYISNRYYYERLLAKEVKLKKELKDIKFESLTISAQLTAMGRRTYILDHIRSKGLLLQESFGPPIVVEALDIKKQSAAIKAKEEHRLATERIRKDTTKNEEIIEE